MVAGNWGVLYGITDSGDLHWYARTKAHDPTASWKPGSGKMIGHGWADFDHVTSCMGYTYTIDEARNMRLHSFSGWQDGTGTWTYHGIIATSFRVYALGAGCADVLYATMGNGDLRWLKYDESEHRWLGPYTIGYGWV